MPGLTNSHRAVKLKRQRCAGPHVAASKSVQEAEWPVLQRHSEQQGLQCNQQLIAKGIVAHSALDSGGHPDMQLNISRKIDQNWLSDLCSDKTVLSHCQHPLGVTPVTAQDVQRRQDKSATLGARSLAHLGHLSRHRARKHSVPQQCAGQALALRDLEA